MAISPPPPPQISKYGIYAKISALGKVNSSSLEDYKTIFVFFFQLSNSFKYINRLIFDLKYSQTCIRWPLKSGRLGQAVVL